MNKEVLFKEVKVHSKRLNEDITLEAYEAPNGEMIISTKSLERYFDFEFCLRNNIKTSKEVEKLSTNSEGEPVYCLCKFVLSDSHGYREESYGESLPGTRTNEIAKNNPFKIAELRAMSAGYIKYLELPGKAYSDSERPLEQIEIGKEDTKEILKKEGEKALNSSKQEEKKTAPTTTSPKKEMTNQKKDDQRTEATKLVSKEPQKSESTREENNLGLQSAPVESAGSIEENAPDDGISAGNVAEAAKDIPENVEKNVSGLPVSESVPESTEETAESSANNSSEITEDELNLKVTFGPAKGRNLTVRDMLNNSEFSNFLENIPKVPKPLDKERQDVIRAFLKALGCYTPEWEQL